MPNMSFKLTTEQMRNKTKTVTRRIGWKNLKPGTIVNACVKCQGLKKGEKIEVIGQIRILKNQPEPLNRMLRLGYGRLEAGLEGFPELTGRMFVEMFCASMKCKQSQIVQRIEFEHMMKVSTPTP